MRFNMILQNYTASSFETHQRNLSLSYNKKITTKREGPFLITEVLGPVNYRLKLPDKWKQ